VGAPTPDAARPGEPRVDYDVPHVKAWGFDMALYLLTKGIGTGAMLLTALLWLAGDRSALTRLAGPAISLLFITVTAVILVADLERPERFYYILVRPNWRSWMVWGAYFLTAHGAIAALWIGGGWLQIDALLSILVWPAVVTSILATSYTGFLFAQGLARDLWQGPHAAVDLIAQAIAEGGALLLVAAKVVGSNSIHWLATALAAAVAVHLAFILFENVLTPSATRHHELAVAAIRRGPFARLFWGGAIAGGGVLPLALLTTVTQGAPFAVAAIGGLLALAGSFAWEYIWVEAGQSVPLS
jgi:formate-dependent nitrite reductase membrane component NrfD